MDELPRDIVDFLDRHISSVMALEVLLHLAKHDRVFDPRGLSSALGGSPDAVILSLEELQAGGLISRTSEADLTYRYTPPSTEANRSVHALSETYARRKVAVVSHIFSRPRDDLRAFSDAFRLRRR